MAKRCKTTPKPCDATNAQVNVTNEHFIALINEINIIGEYDGWWIDIGSSHHACYECAMFKTYTNDENKKVLLGVSQTTNDVDIVEVELKFTFEKNLILKDVMHTPKIIRILFLVFF